MQDVNVVCLVGRLTKDVEVKCFDSYNIFKISLAVNRAVKRNDTWEDDVSYFDCQMFSKNNALSQYLKKGTQIAIKGFLKQDRWEKDGNKQSRVCVSIDDIQLLGSKKESSQNTGYTAPETFSNDVPF